MTWQRISVFLVLFLLLLPGAVLAAEGDGYVRLTGLPYSDINDLSTEGFVNALYLISISLAAFLAVGRIIFAGVQYMLSDIVTSKEQAKKDIQGALLGLGIVLGAVLILQTINPELTEFNFLRNAPKISETLDTSKITNPTFCPTGQFFSRTAANDAGKCVAGPTECKQNDAGCVNTCTTSGGRFTRTTSVSDTPLPCNYSDTAVERTEREDLDLSKECTLNDVAFCNRYCRDEIGREYTATPVNDKIYCLER